MKQSVLTGSNRVSAGENSVLQHFGVCIISFLTIVILTRKPAIANCSHVSWCTKSSVTFSDIEVFQMY